MDAIEAMTARHLPSPIKRFILVGYSKFGNTAWSTACVDRRVAGIVPIAADNGLCMARQLDQLGAPASLKQKFTSGPGKRLLDAGDVYSYRRNLTMPKLDVIGTNDHMSATAASSLYWDGLPGSKWMLYLANVGHGHGICRE